MSILILSDCGLNMGYSSANRHEKLESDKIEQHQFPISKGQHDVLQKLENPNSYNELKLYPMNFLGPGSIQQHPTRSDYKPMLFLIQKTNLQI